LADGVDVAIVGAGFGGLLTGARLREHGVQSVRLIDKPTEYDELLRSCGHEAT
jgi:cation diffusion facilitator CzcD-associated flavoprotein CzcO